jgi:hypothetical protein
MFEFMTRPRRCGSGAVTQAYAVAGEDLASKDGEQDDPLHGADETGRERWALEGEAGIGEAADQKRDEHDRERVVQGERSDDDAGVAVLGLLEPARIEHVPEVADLAGARDARDPARDRHD